MLIATFARRAGMSVDTVRYYVRRGMLRPSTGARGGRNPYQLFTDADLDAAAVIRTCQALGLSLKEITAFLADYRDGRLDDAALIDYLRAQQERLRTKAAELARLIAFLDDKVGWIEGGKAEPIPTIGDSAGTRITPDGKAS